MLSALSGDFVEGMKEVGTVTSIPTDITRTGPSLLEGDESMPRLESSTLDSPRPDFPLT